MWQMAWWVPIEFGFVTAARGLFYARAYRVLGGSRATSRAAVTVSFALFAAAYWASGFLPVTNAIKSVVLGAVFVAAWSIADRTWQGVVLSSLAAVGGPVT